MKPAFPSLFWLSLTAGAFATDGTPIDPATPQPRARLIQTPTTAARREEMPATPAAPPAVLMNKFVVHDSPVPGGLPRRVEPEPEKFSLLRGGPLWKGKIGSLPIEAGMWASKDFMAEDAKFRPRATGVQFDFLRIKF